MLLNSIMPGSVSHISRKDRHHSTHIKSAMEECWPNDYCLNLHESNKRDEYDSEARQLTADPSVQTLSLFILPPDTPCPPFIIHSPFTPSHTSIPPFALHTTLAIITIITQSPPLLTSLAWDWLKPSPLPFFPCSSRDQTVIVPSRLQHWYIVAMTAAVEVGRLEDNACIERGKCTVLWSRAQLNLKRGLVCAKHYMLNPQLPPQYVHACVEEERYSSNRLWVCLSEFTLGNASLLGFWKWNTSKIS